MIKKARAPKSGSQVEFDRAALQEELFAELVHHPAHLIRRSFQIFLSGFELDVGETGLTPVQWIIIATIFCYPGCDMTSLAGLAAVDKTTCGRAVARLDDSGLVRVSADQNDLRQKRLSLTSAGENMVIRALPGVRRLQKRLLAALTPQEQATLLSILEVFVTRNNDQSRAPHRALDPSRPKRKRASNRT